RNSVTPSWSPFKACWARINPIALSSLCRRHPHRSTILRRSVSFHGAFAAVRIGVVLEDLLLRDLHQIALRVFLRLEEVEILDREMVDGETEAAANRCEFRLHEGPDESRTI